MIGGLKVYEKANSFVEIRQRHPDRERVHGRIRRLRRDLDSWGVYDYKYDIARKACDDIVGQSSCATEPLFRLEDHVMQEMAGVRDEDLPRYLFYRYRYEIFPKKTIADDFPPCLQIEPASICNYRCVFCYQTDDELTNPNNGHMGLMGLDLFKGVVDQAEGRCEAVTLASRGEPLINRNIEEMLAYLGGKFLALKVNTNGWFLDERKCHALLGADVNTVVFSVDAASEPLYSRLRVNGRLDRIVANIQRFQEIRARHYPESTTITRVSGVQFCEDQKLEEMERMWGDLVDQVAFVRYNPWENTYTRPFSGIKTACSDLWRRMFVWFDGTVNPCDVDYKSTLAVGNAREDKLTDIWRGEKYETLRAAHLARERGCVSPCNRCTVV